MTEEIDIRECEKAAERAALEAMKAAKMAENAARKGDVESACEFADEAEGHANDAGAEASWVGSGTAIKNEEAAIEAFIRAARAAKRACEKAGDTERMEEYEARIDEYQGMLDEK